MTAGLVLAGLGDLALAAVIDLVVGVHRPRLRPWPYLAGAAGAVCLIVAGARATLGRGGSLDLGEVLGFGHSHLDVDPLAGLFLTLVATVGLAVSLGFAGWVGPPERIRSRGLGAGYALTLGSVVVILLADNAFLFLFAWELLSVAFYLLSGYERGRPGRANASFLTYAVSKSSGAFLLLGFLLLAGRSGSFALSAWSDVGGGGLHGAAYGLLVAGFGAKVGLIPLQIWMPSGYAAAPGPARALMAGVAVNVGFYGLWRTLEILGAPPHWLAIVLLLTAAATALLGIAHATVQTDLQRVIAYSSVENGGLILVGYSVALIGTITSLPRLVAVGLLAASLQAVAHAFAKSALFLASGNIEVATGTVMLDDLQGIGRRMPWSGTGFSIGALTLAGLPPTIGFTSEWFLLEALMQQFRVAPLNFRLAMAAAGALVALTAGFATVAFVRVLGLCILGSPRARSSDRARLPDTGVAGRAGLLLAGLGCLASAALAPLLIRFLAHGLDPVVSTRTTLGALRSPWVVQPVFAEFSILSPSWLWVSLPVLLLLVGGFALTVTRGSILRVRRVPAWRSAAAGVSGEDSYTAFGYANPTRRVLANLLMTRTEMKIISAAEADESGSGFAGPDMPPVEGELARSAAAGHTTAHITYRTDVVELVEAFLYRPLLAPLKAVVRTAKRLQSGRLDAYIAYMLIALLALLAVVTALA